MADKRAIKVETLDRLGASFQESRGITDKLTIEQMIELAKVPTASGDNKLSQIIEGTITEITAEDLEGITQIRDYCCRNCKKLLTVNLRNGITHIGSYAFEYCLEMITLIIPDSVLTLGGSVFKECKKLSNVRIGSGITELSVNLFENCQALINLTIPQNITNIKSYALSIGLVDNKATITFLGTTPPTISTSSLNEYKLNKIIVPKGCGEAYKTATNWANLADYIEEATE